MEKIKISRAVIVEGCYDKIKLESVIDSLIVPTDGFGVFKSDEKKAFLQKLAEKKGLIVLTDSDGAGLVIRNYINSVIPKDRVIHLYVPKIYGKERRKIAPSKEGTLGVEGMKVPLLRELFAPFEDGVGFDSSDFEEITKADLFADGFSGGANSKDLRIKLQRELGLPENISSNALIRAINLLGGRKTYEKTKEGIKNS